MIWSHIIQTCYPRHKRDTQKRTRLDKRLTRLDKQERPCRELSCFQSWIWHDPKKVSSQFSWSPSSPASSGSSVHIITVSEQTWGSIQLGTWMYGKSVEWTTENGFGPRVVGVLDIEAVTVTFGMWTKEGIAAERALFRMKGALRWVTILQAELQPQPQGSCGRKMRLKELQLTFKICYSSS